MNKKGKRSVVMTINTTPEIHAQLDLIAQAEGKTLDDIVNEAIRRVIMREAIRKDLYSWLESLDGTTIELTEEEKEWLNAPPVGREII